MNAGSPNTSYSEDHKLSGVAHADFIFSLRSGVTATTKLPKVQFEVSGLISGTTNPATALKDYLTDTRYGCSVPESEIDTGSFTTAEAVCNRLSSSGIKQYEINALLDSQTPLIENIKIITSCCNGPVSYTHLTLPTIYSV